jgi:primosomal protein DnaI
LTAWGRDEVLEPLLHYRMNENLPTFFTSNLSLEELEKHFVITNTTIDMINARRIIERIKKLSMPIELVSKNIRE